MADRVSQIRARLGHPVIDSDGHYIEFLPLVKERLHALAGPGVVQAFENVVGSAGLARRMDADTKRKLGLVRLPWWGLPARNTLDRATALLPRLLYQRLDEIGLDFAVLYPTYGLLGIHLPDEELRRASCRAFNEYAAEAFADHRDRLTPAAAIPMHTPQEAIDELRHAVGTLGLKVVMLAGWAGRPFPGGEGLRGARWLDFYGFDSPHDYDPVWAECERLGVAPSFHSTGMGWGSRSSLTNYVYNHIGNFAAAGEGTCRALFLSGVPWRFPKLRFAFLEGGVGWACSLYSDLLGHWEKRNRAHIAHYDPANLDRRLLEELFHRHGSEDVRKRIDRLDESLHMLSEPDEDRAGIDEFARCGIERAEDICSVFTGRFHFGCEADDPQNAAAFATRTNPLGARLRAIFSSDIGHWDVPDMTEVLPEAWELVEDGLLSEADFRDFVFGFPLALWGGANPAFFRGTVIEAAAGAV